ncbi:NAD(P)-binding protein [Gymnopus androsaceus JB14]|uniref:NAD(P)-binding protein n=1 Tax=Gymnopus androsaceus JB14 TaxID=1447944 RepID=A0A6A4H1N4_9AGAR|nr:NAD(P)-binding protein [Gymnopus androsaceus JB14]
MKSQRIAVAGGNGKIGKHIVEGLLEIKQQHSLEIIVLSRTHAPEGISYAGSTAPIIAVDYQDENSIQRVLNEYQIDTIISTLSGDGIAAQESLLRAGLAVPTFRRFAPSEFAIDSEQVKGVKFYNQKLPILRSLQEVKAERGPGSFEYTRFNCGIFMNYLGFGNTKPDGHKAHGYLAHFPWIIDLSKRTADVPGDGEKMIVYTGAEDVGKFVAAATQLEVWEEHSDMAGEVMTFNQVIRVCEEVCGVKFDVKYNTREDIVARMSPDLDRRAEGIIQFYLAYIDGDCDVKRPINLNKLVDVKPMTVREYLQQWWA